MVYTEHAPTAAVLDGTSYATTKERTTVPTSCCVTVKLPVVIISVAHDKHSGSAQKQRTLYLPLALWLDAKRCLTSAHINKNYIRWLGGNSSTRWVRGTSATQIPCKLHSVLCINPFNWTFPNCNISFIMDQSTKKTTTESDCYK